MDFEEHGDHDITFDGKMVMVEATGPWNKESLLSYVKKMKVVQTKAGHSCIACIIVLRGESILTLDAKEELTELQTWRIKMGFDYPSAFVFPEEGEYTFNKALYADIYRDRKNRPEFFKSVEDAKKWLLEK